MQTCSFLTLDFQRKEPQFRAEIGKKARKKMDNPVVIVIRKSGVFGLANRLTVRLEIERTKEGGNP